MSERIRRRFVVRGRVQGVGFRYSVQARAQAEGVAGWACNRYDGAVEAVLEGPPDAVDRVARFLESGPALAKVEQVERHDEAVEGLRRFEAR